MSSDDYPGRMMEDKERTPRGLGWEYARRKWKMKDCPFVSKEEITQFRRGFRGFLCTDDKVNNAMLNKGVPISKEG